MLIFLGLIVLACAAVGGALHLGARRRIRREAADDLEAAGLRLAAAGEIADVHDCNAHKPYTHIAWGKGTVYTSSAATAVEVVPTGPPIDVWMVKAVTVDPTLTATDVATAVEHVAPGVGSMASFAAAVEDTRMRTSAQLRELHEAEEAAYAEASERGERLFFAEFDRRMEAAFTDFAVGTRHVARWADRFHDGAHYANCEHCARVHDVHSDEYALIVADRAGTDTGVFSLAELRAELAAA